MAAALLLVCASPAGATSAGQVSVNGSDYGTYMRLYVEGDFIVIVGAGAESRVGCTQTDGNTVACPIAGASSIEVSTGAANDRVEVRNPLPVPLTVRLGGDSDKFFGNDEDDTCYPEGAKRNRCYGYRGDDVCITGNKNSDCIGGLGDDFCRHGAGSDGCWGGPGRDVCVMGAGEDGCHGGAGNDRLFGGPGADQLYGGQGRDYCAGGPGVGRSQSCELGPGR